MTLLWKEFYPILLSHHDLSIKRLAGLFRHLRQTPDILQLCDTDIKDQLEQGIVEVVDDIQPHNNLIHYLPHYAVLREDKATTKLRTVHDTSACTSRKA